MTAGGVLLIHRNLWMCIMQHYTHVMDGYRHQPDTFGSNSDANANSNTNNQDQNQQDICRRCRFSCRKDILSYRASQAEDFLGQKIMQFNEMRANSEISYFRLSSVNC
jgi:hypothetical protein